MWQAAVRAAERRRDVPRAGVLPAARARPALRGHHGGRAQHHPAHGRRALRPAPAAARLRQAGTCLSTSAGALALPYCNNRNFKK